MKKTTVYCPMCGREIIHLSWRNTIDKIVTCKNCYTTWKVDARTGMVTRSKQWDATKNGLSNGRVLS